MSDQASNSGAPTIAALVIIAAIGIGVASFTQGQPPADKTGPIARGAPIRGAPITTKKAPAKPQPGAIEDAAKPTIDDDSVAPQPAAKVEAPKIEKPAVEKPAPPKPEAPKPTAEATPVKAPKPAEAPKAKAPVAAPETAPQQPAAREAKPAEPAVTKATETPAEEKKSAGLQTVDFEKLAGYTYKTPWGKVTKEMLTKQIPDDILAYSGKTIRVTGYMLPMDIADNGDVRAFFLMKDLASCCFGGTPRMNEWILVNVKDGVQVRYIAYQAIDVDGPIEVGEKIENGRLSSLYRMTATAVTPKT